MTAPKKHSANANLKAASPQAFDIIPRSRVIPSASARPIIPGNQPPQADNSLKAPPGDTPTLSAHGKIHIAPLGDEAEKKTVVPAGALTAEELKAKLTARSETADKVEAEEAEASDEPIETIDEPKAEDAKPDEEVNDDKDDKSDQPQPGSVEHALKEDEPEASIEHSQALKDELQGMSDDNAEKANEADDSDTDEHGRHHHELYGGKPVIVIHKHRRGKHTMLWIVWLLFCLLLAVAAVDVLLDADIITTDYNVPHTDFL